METIKKKKAAKRRHDVVKNPLSRNKVVILRCTEGEYSDLAKMASKHGSISAYIRQCVFGEITRG